MLEELKVKIHQWELYNPRKDVRVTSWLRFQNDFFDNANFYALSGEERLAWLYLLCERSKQRLAPGDGDFFTVNTEHFHRVTAMPPTVLKSAIEKLKAKQLLDVRTLRGRYVPVTPTGATRRDDTGRDMTERDETGRDVTKDVSRGGAFAPPDGAPEAPPGFTMAMHADAAAASKPRKRAKPHPMNGTTWEAYAEAYRGRYRVEPVRNATVNAQISNLVRRLGEEAPHVVRFYLGQNRAYYLQSCHPVGLCLRDAEALRTQWANNTHVLPTQARQMEQRAHNTDVWDRAAETLAARAEQEP